jgi:aryl-alcohol dehydrogenase-like predicted oxidoreductase
MIVMQSVERESMRYKLLGKSGLRVSELCLGTMTFGETWGWGASQAVSRQMFDRFAGAGGNFIDTSVNYTDGTSETLLGEFLKDAGRERFVIATKYSLTRPDSADPNSGGNSRKNMVQSVERSLKRLQTDYIDLYYLHAWDYMTPIEEVMRGLDDLVRVGKVVYIGVSDSPAWVVSAANMLAELRGWARFVGLQVPYSLADRAIERELTPMAKAWDMAVLPWGLLEGGLLTGKFLTKTDTPTRINPADMQMSERVTKIVLEVQQVAQETGRTMSQVAINWVRQQQQALMIPILGARTDAQLQDNLAVLDWQLNEEQLKRLDTVSKIDLGFPHNFLPGNEYLFGATFATIDNHRQL